TVLRGAGSAAALAVAPWEEVFAEHFEEARAAAPYPPESIVTACGICDSACGMRVTVKDGAVRFIQGLPEDPHNEGRLCAKGTASAWIKNDPDRLKFPMMRTNPRKGFEEDPRWVRISWTEALDTIAARFREIRDAYGPEALLAVSRGKPPWFARLYSALGMERVDHNDLCYGVDIVVSQRTIGAHSHAWDLENAKYIVLFGWDMITRAKLALANRLVHAKENGARVINFNPLYTATAKFSDEWHPVRPGGDLAVALAMIHVLLEENLYDKEFVGQYTNFGEHEAAIRGHFAQYSPEWAEPLCDVPANVIRRVAREFGSVKPAVAPLHKKTPAANYENAAPLCHAIAILNILAGNIDRPGGHYFPRTISIPALNTVYPPPTFPKTPSKRVDGREKLPLAGGYGMFSTLADGMTRVYPGRVKFLFWNNYHLNSFPDYRRLAEALKTVEFMVLVDILPMDAMYFADIVLPSTMFLEGSDLISRELNAKAPFVVVRQPVTPAPFEAKSASYIALELGKRLAPESFKKPDGSWSSGSELLDEQVRRAGLGENFAEFRKKGFFAKEQPFTPRTTFATATGKCQIYVPEFAAKNYEPLPSWRPKRDLPSAEYPYYLITVLPGEHKRNSTQNNPILNEIGGESYVRIHPSTAQKHGIGEGSMVRVRSRVGEVVGPARLTETVRPDVVVVPHGFGHKSPWLRVTGGKGFADNDLIPSQSTDEAYQHGNWLGAGCIMDCVVAIEPVQ
ncbi:MAG: molybdopterin-containing oxidoreductase family protein, partial [Bryobacteraceae bacterium]